MLIYDTNRKYKVIPKRIGLVFSLCHPLPYGVGTRGGDVILISASFKEKFLTIEIKLYHINYYP